MTLTCAYTATAVGAIAPATIAARMAAPPPDLTLPQIYGLRLTGDTTTISGNLVTRTFVFAGDPVSPAAFTATLDTSDTASPILSTSRVQSGSGYAAPPIVSVSPAPNPAAGSQPPEFLAQMGLTDVLVLAEGAGYDVSTTTVVVSGGQLAPGGVQATVAPTYIDGRVTAVVVLTPGGPYNVPPTISLIDSAGAAGAVLSAGLGVQSLLKVRGGSGFASPPTFTFTPLFDAKFATDTAKKHAIAAFMTTILGQAVNAQVVASPVVVA